MRQPPTTSRRTTRLAAVVVLLAAIIGSLVVTLSPTPAGAVPVDGLYTGTISNSSTMSSAPLSVTLSTTAPARTAVSAAVTIGSGATISCLGTHDIASSFTMSAMSGGVASASGVTAPPIVLTGTQTVTVGASTFNLGVTVIGNLSANRTSFTGSAIVTLPFGCGAASLTFATGTDLGHHIRTGHDGTLDSTGTIDLTHMIDRNPPGSTENGKRCMYLWADPLGGTSNAASASWSIEGPAVAGARIEPGWSGGTPANEPSDGTPRPMRTRVCIDDTTPLDSTFRVAFAPDGGPVTGRIVLWVGTYRPYPGRAQGDVHNTTFDGLHYDFQGVGEYVDAVAGDGGSFAVQSRLETVPNTPVTVTTAVAARVDGDRVAAYLDAKGAVQWYLDGKPIAVPAKLPSGGEITNPSADHWRVTWPATSKATAGTSMQVSFARWTPKDHLNIDELLLGPALAVGQVRGLLGVADRDPLNDLTPSTGGDPVSAEIDPKLPAYVQPLYAAFGRSWLVEPSPKGALGTLFDYLDPNHPDPASYQNETFPAERAEVVDRKARAVCQRAGVTAWPQIDFCTYDIEVTGAREIAAYYRDGWLPA